MAGRQPRSAFSGEVAGRLKGSESLHLIPIYISGGDTIRYPEVGYFTSSEAKYYKRREALSDTKTDGTVRVLDRKGHSEVDYRESMLVPQTFAGRVQLQQLLHTCCEEHLLASEAIAVPERAVTVPDTVYTTVAGMLPFPVAAVSVPLFETNVTFVRPKPEAVKERTATATVRITYPVNDWRVYPDFENNRQELSRIDKSCRPWPPIRRPTASFPPRLRVMLRRRIPTSITWCSPSSVPAVCATICTGATVFRPKSHGRGQGRGLGGSARSGRTERHEG